MSRFILSGPLLAFLLATVATSVWSRPAAKAVLNLSDKPYSYDKVELPAHSRRDAATTTHRPTTRSPITARRAAVLGGDATYAPLFNRAFGSHEVTEERIGKALAQFVRSMVSYQSRYDQGRARAASAQDDFHNFTLQENRGKALFMRNCTNCHISDGDEHFFVPTPANSGLRGKEASDDGGIGDVTLRPADLGAFKSPSLRNVAVTAPYGHDGRFANLDVLMDHYSDVRLSDQSHGYMIPAEPSRFTRSEKASIIAFLKTLTDEKFLTDPKFSNPFTEQEEGHAHDVLAICAGSARQRVHGRRASGNHRRRQGASGRCLFRVLHVCHDRRRNAKRRHEPDPVVRRQS